MKVLGTKPSTEGANGKRRWGTAGEQLSKDNFQEKWSENTFWEICGEFLLHIPTTLLIQDTPFVKSLKRISIFFFFIKMNNRVYLLIILKAKKLLYNCKIGAN